MNRVKAWLPLGYIPQNCTECCGLQKVGDVRTPAYICVSNGIVLGQNDCDLIGKCRPEWCQMIIEGGKNEATKTDKT